MEYVGHAPTYREVVVRGDLDKREFTMFWLDDDSRVIAGMNVNVWEGLDDIKGLIRARRPMHATALADSSIGLSSLA